MSDECFILYTFHIYHHQNLGHRHFQDTHLLPHHSLHHLQRQGLTLPDSSIACLT